MLIDKSGIFSYLNTADMMAISNEIKYEFYMDALIYQIAKEVGSLCFIMDDKIDDTIFVGYIIHGKMFMNKMLKYIKQITDEI